MIRTARQSDIEMWSLMRSQLWPDTDDAHLGEIEAYFAGSSNDIEQVFVALEPQSSEVLGFIELNIRSFAEGSANKGVPYVEGWFVEQQYRGLGYGSSLMNRAEQWALDSGFSELASDTELTNIYSQKTHERLGFTEVERVVCYIKRLN